MSEIRVEIDEEPSRGHSILAATIIEDGVPQDPIRLPRTASPNDISDTIFHEGSKYRYQKGDEKNARLHFDAAQVVPGLTGKG